ncbi:hypothetical protein ACB092_03G057200 [Castanea dentata]
MGIDDIWGYAICICRVRRYYLRKNENLQLHNLQHVLKKFRESSRKRYMYLRRSHVQSKLKRLKNICTQALSKQLKLGNLKNKDRRSLLGRDQARERAWNSSFEGMLQG